MALTLLKDQIARKSCPPNGPVWRVRTKEGQQHRNANRYAALQNIESASL
jgi:uncharacterized metal-binding protein YceD (DUF177 family)